MADEIVITPTENNNETPQADTAPVEVAAVIDENTAPVVEIVSTQTGKTTTVAELNNQVAETKPQPTEKKPSQSSRFSGMVNFSGEKGRIVTEIIEKGIEDGYWKTKQQFYDKIFDFGINSQLVHAHLNVTDAYIFGVPDSVQTKLFTNGFYENDSQLKLEKC